ncbi:cytochrome C oxidase subunit II [Achromobacter sp. RTa]|uniref:TorD/DmsD family molecular chaperone n=1 Tax=Achromobacter sp. RTa TaxID=1532557 RepID=UPI00050F683A|nr:molecular chaperone TorD family protein [Achromobacter sp. RTa]KGD90110.1 cytochrome C oxidase subunit II [Achromobacter sp. RTa]
MTVSASAAIPPPSDFDEEVARADIYGLLAQLFYAPPPPELLEALRQAEPHAPDAGSFLETPWQDLMREARALDDAAIAAEYDALFGGMGKPEVYLFGSHYLTGFLNEKPLVGLRNDLQALGLARDPSVSETEDHIAFLCEVMRYLIAGDDASVSNLARQREFFSAHIQPWVHDMAAAIAAHPAARFYARSAAFIQAFASVEAQGFDMLG